MVAYDDKNDYKKMILAVVSICDLMHLRYWSYARFLSEVNNSV